MQLYLIVVFTAFFSLVAALPIRRSPSESSSLLVSRQESGEPKRVVAHHMIGNTFPYTPKDWAEDVQLANDAGIDGFALNMGIDEWQPARVHDAYEAARESGRNFTMFLSLDMASFPCGSPEDASRLRNLVNAHVDHPAQLKYRGRAFVSTFAGENCNFGQGSAADGWRNQFAQHPELKGKIFFVPAFFIDPATFGNFEGVMDGDFNWNSAWAIQVTKDFAQQELTKANEAQAASAGGLLRVVTGAVVKPLVSVVQKLESEMRSTLSPLQRTLTKFVGATGTDAEHRSGLEKLPAGGAYMGSVSPWFFTHYGTNSFNKNFVYMSDQHLYPRRWESIVQERDNYDIIQVLTWNDYGESHYIGPIKGAQPNSESWTNGMTHTSWLKLTKYYAEAYKTGSFPAITQYEIFMWSRPHSAKATCQDPVGQPTNFELFEDQVWVVVMATQPSKVTLKTGAGPEQQKTFDVPEGVTKLAMPISPGGFFDGTIERAGKVVVELKPEQFHFHGSPPSYNFNAFVDSATAA